MQFYRTYCVLECSHHQKERGIIMAILQLIAAIFYLPLYVIAKLAKSHM